MNWSPSDVTESLNQAKTTMETLHDRALQTGSIDDRAELSLLGTTVRKIEELMQVASDYDEIMRQQLARASTRIKLKSS